MFCSIMRGNHEGDLIKAVCFGKYSTLVVETAITVFHSNTTNLGCLLDLVTEETLIESWFCLTFRHTRRSKAPTQNTPPLFTAA